MDFNTPKKPQLGQYKAAEDELSNVQLTTATWLVRHRYQLQKLGTFILGAIGFGLLTYSLVLWGEYIIFGYVEDQAMRNQQVVEIENYRALQPAYAAQNIIVNNSTVLRSGTDKYDFITEVINPNERWVAQVEYKYVFNGGETPLSTALILPQQKHLIPELGFQKGSFPSQARLVIRSVRWRSIPAQVVPDVPAYINERIQFQIPRVSFGQSRTDGAPSNSVLFDITNPSAYGYREASFYVVFFDRNTIVAVRPLTLYNFEAGTTEEVDFRLVTVTNRISDIDIIPVINVFDSTLFIDPES